MGVGVGWGGVKEKGKKKEEKKKRETGAFVGLLFDNTLIYVR